MRTHNIFSYYRKQKRYPSCLEGGPLLWIWPLYLHVNQKSDDDDDDDDHVMPLDFAL